MLSIQVRHKIYPDASRSGGRHLALEDLAFEVPSGQFACLVGPSGCGKSTLLNIVAGLDRDYRGQVSLDGQDPARAAAFMFQTPRLLPWLSVLDNVALVLQGAKDARARARRLLTEMGLGDVLDTWPNRLSGGMQRRVALARAFAPEPQLLLMDEPFISLDQPSAQRLRDMLLGLWSTRRTTVVFVTHDLNEALALGDRVLFMSADPGRVVLDVPLDLPRPRCPEHSDVVAFKGRLLKEHPRLLAGLVEMSAA